MSRSETTIKGKYNDKVSKSSYLVTISCCRKKDDINEFMIMDVIIWLKDNGVVIHDNVFSDHGTYRQVHWHGVCGFSGRFKGLTRFDWVSGPDDETPVPFKISWSRIRGRFGLSNVSNYLQLNEKPKGLLENEEVVSDFYKKIDINGYPNVWEA